MSNQITKDGIETDDLQTILAELTEDFKNIYGQDINLEQSTPDGQLINILAQAKRDTLDLAVQSYNLFNPETVIGRAQDNLYKLIGLYRKASKFSFVQVNVTITAPANLQGLDDDVENPDGVGYTLSDTNGNNFILVNSTNLTSAGTYLLDFRAQNIGAIQVLPNTIKNMVSVIRGVSYVNNPSVQYQTGNDEETDAEFRIRFNKSRSLSGKGFNDSLLAALLNINLVTDAQVYSNRTNVTDSDGTPAHSVWVIVEGGTDEEVAEAIYSNVSDGSGMRGAQQVALRKSNGLFETIYFDRAQSEPLYVKATLKNLTTRDLDLDAIKQALIQGLNFKIYGSVDTAEITCILRDYSSDYVPYNVEISVNNTTWAEYLLPQNKQNKFTLTADNITLTVE